MIASGMAGIPPARRARLADNVAENLRQAIVLPTSDQTALP